MNDDRSLERAARSWLEDGPTQAPDRAVDAALLHIETTSQERDLRVPWRFRDMPILARVAAAAVIGVLVIGGAFFAFGRLTSNVGAPGPSPGPSPLDGSWQTCPTERDILVAGGNSTEASGNAGCTTLTFRDGVFRETGGSAVTKVPGTYTVDDTAITITRPNGEVFDFTWSRTGDTLALAASPKTGSTSPAPWIAKPFQRTAGETPIDGTWRACPSAAEIVAAGGTEDEAAGNAGCTMLEFHDGVFRESGASAATQVSGRFTVTAASVTIDRWNAEVFDFGWTISGDRLMLTKSTKSGAVSPAPWLALPFERSSP